MGVRFVPPSTLYLVMIYLLTPFVIQSEAKNLENIIVDLFLYVTEIFRYAQQHVFLPSVVWRVDEGLPE